MEPKALQYWALFWSNFEQPFCLNEIFKESIRYVYIHKWRVEFGQNYTNMYVSTIYMPLRVGEGIVVEVTKGVASSVLIVGMWRRIEKYFQINSAKETSFRWPILIGECFFFFEFPSLEQRDARNRVYSRGHFLK